MGVKARVVLHARDQAAGRLAARLAFGRIAELEAVMSDYRPKSELMRVCAAGTVGRRTISDDLYRVLRRAQEIARETDGAFDVTIGPLVRLWRRARITRTLPDGSSVTAAMDHVGHGYLVVHGEAPVIEFTRPGMLLDLGGIGKGFAADEALAILAAAGHTRCLVDMGGDIAAGDPPPGADAWRVAVGGGSSSWVRLVNQGVATSGDGRQFVEIDGTRYSHIVDPATGLGLTDRPTVTVIAPDATTADALASAVSVLGPQRGRTVAEHFKGTRVLVTEQTSRDRR